MFFPRAARDEWARLFSPYMDVIGLLDKAQRLKQMPVSPSSCIQQDESHGHYHQFTKAGIQAGILVDRCVRHRDEISAT